MVTISIVGLNTVYDYCKKSVLENLNDFNVQLSSDSNAYLRRGNCLFVFNTKTKDIFTDKSILFDDASSCYIISDNKLKNCAYDPDHGEFEIWVGGDSDYVTVNDLLGLISGGETSISIMHRRNGGYSKHKCGWLERGLLHIV